MLNPGWSKRGGGGGYSIHLSNRQCYPCSLTRTVFIDETV